MIINSYSIKELHELGQNDEELYNMCMSIEEMSKDPTFLAAGVYNKEEMEENLKRWYRQEFMAEFKEEAIKEGKKEEINKVKLENQREMALKLYNKNLDIDSM